MTDLGATLVSLKVKNKEGSMADVVLGYENAAGYEAGTCFFGTIVGRNANRIGGAQFELNGKTYHLTGNDNGNNLHSGMDFYNIRIWETEEVTETSVRFKLHSPDGDQGYPGTADIYVTYSLDKDDKLDIFYEALSDKDTILNMTNHSYFNLDGHNSGSVLQRYAYSGGGLFYSGGCTVNTDRRDSSGGEYTYGFSGRKKNRREDRGRVRTASIRKRI